MAALIDRVLAQGFYKAEGVLDVDATTKFREIYDGEGWEVFETTNVARYWFDHNPPMRDELEVFPNVAPPFPAFWIEFDATENTKVGVAIMAQDLAERYAAMSKERIRGYEQAFYQAFDTVDGSDWAEDTDRYFDAWSQVVFGSHGKGIFHGRGNDASILDGAAGLYGLTGIRWIMSLTPCKSAPADMGVPNPGVGSPLMVYIIPVFAGGKIYTTKHGRIRAVLGEHGIEFADWFAKDNGLTKDGSLAEIYQIYRDYAIYPALMAISFLNCKNVVQERVAPQLSRQMKRYLERTGDRPPVTYKVLNIEPMKRVLTREGGIESSGITRALHICRGHFAQYTEAKPLFGRVTGMVWRPAHTRGSVDAGVVDKDYQVDRPKGGRK
jgi:hypothetical protein